MNFIEYTFAMAGQRAAAAPQPLQTQNKSIGNIAGGVFINKPQKKVNLAKRVLGAGVGAFAH